MYNPPSYKVLLGSTSNGALVNDAIDDGECGTGSSFIRKKDCSGNGGFYNQILRVSVKGQE
jgi:hypothetical protein